ncbi:MAG: VCBS repeat-containing protein, partial [Ignavibacteriales bacterium]|nr:VCBS repeat-containing protein [Ignavibacteriales bacterium]
MKHTYSFSPTPKKIAMALFFGIFFLLHSINLVAQVSSVTPTPNVLNENLTVNIVANFSTSMNQSTMNNNTVRVHGSLRGSIAGSISTQSNKLTFNPTANFEYNEVITVTLTAGIQTSGGSPITPYSWQFSTGVQPSTGFFTEKARPNVGTSPYGIAAGDYDNDGFFDLAVANTGSNNVSLLSFVNDSTYDPAVHTSVGDSPRGIISGDWDNDGDLDLATANFSSNNISILTNNGTGSFTVVNDTSNGEGTIALVAFDLDGDGDLDITAVNNVSLSIVVLFNDGNGDFTANTPANMANPPIAIAYGDIDGDKDLDVIVTTTLSVDLYLNNGPGSITYSAALPVETAPSFTGVANIDGDSDMDLVVISSAANYVTLFKNDGTGDFPDTLHSAVATGGVSVGFFDKDNDGDLDAGVVHSTQNYVTILQNGGSGNYTFSSLASVRNTPQSIVVLDYQRTGGIDIAVTNSGAHNVSVLKNVNTASNTAQISGKIFEDMNGNGVQDPEDTQGLQGWKIYMSGNVVDSTTTDNLGKYNFGSLPAGTYYITQVVEDEWYRTFPESNTDTISLASAANDTGHNFGNFRYGKISGIKFSDADGDGVKDNN